MKRVLWVLALLSLCFTCACALGESEGFKLENGSLCSIPEGMVEVVFPAEVAGEKALGISSFACANNEEITGVTVPEGVVMLENGAIYGSDRLVSLTLPSTLEIIDNYNLFACDALESVTIPAAVRFIGAHSFFSCDELKQITFLGLPPVIRDDAFMYLHDDAVVYVPDDCLEDYLAVLPEELNVQPSGQKAIAAPHETPESDFLFDAATGTVNGYTGTDWSIAVPQTIDGVAVTAIGEGAFEYSSCRYVSLPEGVVRLAARAFGHSKLVGMALPSSLVEIGPMAFEWATRCGIIWPKDNHLETIGEAAFGRSVWSNTVVIPEGVRVIGDRAFENVGIGELYFPASLTYIGSQAFKGSDYLGYIAFAGADIPEIADDAFTCSENLLDVDIAWNADRAQYDKAVERFAALGMAACTVWRNNPASAGVCTAASTSNGAQYDRNMLVACADPRPDLSVYTSVDDVRIYGVGERCFEGSGTIRSFYPHHCGWFTTIEPRAFADSSLEYVELFDSITTIGEEAFVGTRLTAVTIPASVTEIGSAAFARCEELRQVTLLCDVAVLPDDVFAQCHDLTVYVPDGASAAEVSKLADRLGANVSCPSGTPRLAACPYPATDPEMFSIDDQFNRLDHYWGYDVNLVLPAEKNGVALTMLSGNTLFRARDDQAAGVCELPVRSVVVPEGYNAIVYDALCRLPTAEVVVIYAPLDQAFNSMFVDCPSLRAVVFVNGVDRVVDQAFINCPALETVYVGNAEVSANAFRDCGSMTPQTVTRELPDVDALLAAVQSPPIAAPVADPEPETMMPDPEPITDSQAAAYLGTWQLLTVKMGSVYTAEEFGMEMQLVLRDDGMAVMVYDGEADATVWRMTDGQATILADGETFSPIVMNDDGTLMIGSDSIEMTFARAEGEAPASEMPGSANAQGGDAEFVGEWTCIWLATAGAVGNDPRTAYSADWRLILNADGTGAMKIGDAEPGTWYVDDDGITRYDDMAIIIRPDGRLQYGSAMSGGMIFARDPADVWDPDVDAFAVPGEVVAAQTSQQAAEERIEQGIAAAQAPAALADRIGQKYVCTTVTTGGVTMDGAAFGEYAITFAADGQAQFVMAGYEVPGLVWTADDVSFHVTYFDGTDLVFAATETGFDLDFYGSMLMHMTLAE